MTTYTNDIYGVQQQIADEQAKSEKQFISDSYNLANVQGAGMMLNARDIGTRQGDVYANLGRMLTGEEEAVDPRMARMQKLQAIMEQVPEPDTVDEYIQLANLMNQAGLYGEAQEAMKMANEIRSSMPTPDYTTVKVGDTDEKGNRITKTILYKDGQPFKELGEQLTDAPTEVDLETQVYEANLVPYMEAAMVELETTNPKGLSGVELTKEARKMAQREYSKVPDLANSFEQAALQTLEEDPTFLALSGPEQIEKYAANYRLFHPDNTDSANEASLKNIRDDFIVKAQAKLKAAGDENWEEGGITAGDFDFHEFKTNAQKEIQAGNTDLTSVLAQYKIWDDRSTPILKDMDALSNLQYQIQIAKDEDNGQAWQAAQRGFVALMKDSNLSLAEVETVKNAGNLVRKAFNKISEWSTGVPTVEHIAETLAIMSHMEKIIVNRYNDKHTKFNESMSIAGSTPEILKAISGDKMEIVITSLNASIADVQEAIARKLGAAEAAGQ